MQAASVLQVKLQFSPRIRVRLIECSIIVSIGLVIAWIIGFLQNQSPAGDDAYYYVGMTKVLVSNFPYLSWDPRLFAGSVPTIGLSFVTFAVPMLLVALGLGPIPAFHVSFIAVFLLFGLAVFFFAKTVGSGTVFSLSMTMLAWSTTAYWNNSVWGGAYDRIFSIPLLFMALATSYRYVIRQNAGTSRSRDYFVCVALWTLTLLGDVFTAVVASTTCAIFLVFSEGPRNFIVGVKRLAVIFLPVAGLTLWQTVPILLQAANVEGFRRQFTESLGLAVLILPGSVWVSTLNYVYLPLLIVLLSLCLLLKPRFLARELALLASLGVMGVYWVVMGWIPQLWPYVPRLMATYSSVENLAWLMLLSFPLLFTVLRRDITGRQLIRLGSGSYGSLAVKPKRFLRIVTILALLFVAGDSIVVLPTIVMVQTSPLADQLNSGLNQVMGQPSSDYRVSLQNRFLTRTFLYYQPSRFDTGGRVENLDPNPLFNNWYLTDVFYKNDLRGLGGVFNDDRPPTNMTYLLESPYNFAGENFWLDWYGVNGVAFYPYALGNTVGNYTSRSSIFSTTIIDTSYGVNEVIVKPTSPSPILTATNSTIVGLYSLSTSSEFEYQTLISILSKMGLDSRYVIPIYLPTIQDVLKAPLNLLVTDSSTYSQQSQALRSVFDTSDVVVVSSIDGIIGSSSTTSPVGSHSLVNIPVSFSQLLNGQEPAAYSFANSTRLVPSQTVNPTGSTYYPAADIALSPSSWMNAYQTPNARGTFQTSGNSLIVNLTSSNPSTRSQFNILSHLSSLLPLTKGLTVSFSIQSSANITLGTVFTSPASCCPNYVANDTTIGPGVSYQMIIPFSSFSKWHNSTSMFGETRDLTLALNLPPAEPNTIVKLTNVTISSPAYTIATLPSSVPLTSDGAIQYNTLVSGVGLLASTNSSTAILSPSSNTRESVVTISSLSGGQTGQPYDRVITVGGNLAITPSIELFSESAWRSVHEEWTTNQNMVANNLPQGFRGLVWKETYTQFWTFQPGSNGSGQPLPYYYAGPGMIYVPLSEPVSLISATYDSTTPISIVLFSSPIATLIIMAIFRKKLTALGQQGRIEQAKT